jgi:hypothetical protein
VRKLVSAAPRDRSTLKMHALRNTEEHPGQLHSVTSLAAVKPQLNLSNNRFKLYPM